MDLYEMRTYSNNKSYEKIDCDLSLPQLNPLFRKKYNFMPNLGNSCIERVRNSGRTLLYVMNDRITYIWLIDMDHDNSKDFARDMKVNYLLS